MWGSFRAAGAAVAVTAFLGAVAASAPPALAAESTDPVVQANPCTSTYSFNAQCRPRFTGYEQPQPYHVITPQEADQRARQKFRQVSCTVVRVVTPLFRAG